MSIDPMIGLTLRLAMALLFALAVAHKLSDLTAFRSSLVGYLRGFAMADLGLERPLSLLIVLLEVLIVTACLLPSAQIMAGILASTILFLYAVAMAVNLLRGRLRGEVVRLDCGCSWGGTGQYVRPALVVRNVVLGAAALLIVLPVGGRGLGILDLASAGLATLSAALLYASFNQILSLELPLDLAHRSDAK